MRAAVVLLPTVLHAILKKGAKEKLLLCPAAACCLFTRKCHLTLLMCVLLRAMELDGEIGPPSSLMTIECVL